MNPRAIGRTSTAAVLILSFLLLTLAVFVFFDAVPAQRTSADEPCGKCGTQMSLSLTVSEDCFCLNPEIREISLGQRQNVLPRLQRTSSCSPTQPVFQAASGGVGRLISDNIYPNLCSNLISEYQHRTDGML